MGLAGVGFAARSADLPPLVDPPPVDPGPVRRALVDQPDLSVRIPDNVGVMRQDAWIAVGIERQPDLSGLSPAIGGMHDLAARGQLPQTIRLAPDRYG